MLLSKIESTFREKIKQVICHVSQLFTIIFLLVLPNQIKEVIQYFPTHNIKLKLLPSLRKGQYHLFQYMLFNKVDLFPYSTGGSVITWATCFLTCFCRIGLIEEGRCSRMYHAHWQVESSAFYFLSNIQIIFKQTYIDTRAHLQFAYRLFVIYMLHIIYLPSLSKLLLTIERLN